MLTFGIRFVYPFLSSIAMGCGTIYYVRRLLPVLDELRKSAFFRNMSTVLFYVRERGDFHKFMQFGYLWPKDNCAAEQIRLIAYDKIVLALCNAYGKKVRLMFL